MCICLCVLTLLMCLLTLRACQLKCVLSACMCVFLCCVCVFLINAREYLPGLSIYRPVTLYFAIFDNSSSLACCKLLYSSHSEAQPTQYPSSNCFVLAQSKGKVITNIYLLVIASHSPMKTSL